LLDPEEKYTRSGNMAEYAIREPGGEQVFVEEADRTWRDTGLSEEVFWRQAERAVKEIWQGMLDGTEFLIDVYNGPQRTDARAYAFRGVPIPFETTRKWFEEWKAKALKCPSIP
jgi:hypothetical protein